MSEAARESDGSLSVKWLGWAWFLPQVALACLNWHAWILMRGDMSGVQHVRAVQLGLFEAILLASGLLLWVVQSVRQKPIGVGLALAAVAAHTGYLWWFLQSIDRLVPATVGLWMLPDTELVFYQFSLMMPVVFLMLVRLARIRLRVSTPVDVGLSLAALVVVPGAFFILGSLLVRLERNVSWHVSLQYMLLAAMVAGTAFILVAFLRLLIRLHALVARQGWSEWAIPLAAGVVAPLAGLGLNATIPFPYDFQDVAVYAMALLNGLALLIPFRPGSRWAIPGWAARAVFYPFSAYFFLVFLPFLPLSLLAMIAAGSGFLILAPLFLFVVHSRRLWEQGRALAAEAGVPRVAAVFAACVLVLPAGLLLRNELDRRTLNRAVDAVFNPDYAATAVPFRPAALARALDRMDDLKNGVYLPYVTDLYNAMVFHGMVLPDEKAALIRQCLLGGEKGKSKREGMWGNGFLGGRRTRERRSSGAGVTREVVLASHEESRLETNGMTECGISFVLENRGAGNGEFSERIAVPEGVLVTGFWLEVNGTNKPALIRERKAATWVYEMIRDMTRRDPGLVVFEDDRDLRLRVFPFSINEKRRCGLQFRFPAALSPSIRIGSTAIALGDPLVAVPWVGGVDVALEGGGTALAVPAWSLNEWPAFRRDAVAHLILDRSAGAETNQVALVERARDALAALPASISRVRLTWANFEQEDQPGGVMTREEAMRALDRAPALPFQGGFCAERVVMRVLLAESRAPRDPAPAGYASLFVVVPAPGQRPLKTASLAPFERLAPDLPAYALFDGERLIRVPFDPDEVKPAAAPDFAPDPVVAIRHGSVVTPVRPTRDTVIFSEAATSVAWDVWSPASGRFDKTGTTATCDDRAYRAGLSLWARHRALVLDPPRVEEALPSMVGDARSAGVLVPEAAFIVLETQSQDVMLARKEKQSLGANQALEFDDVSGRNAPAPPAVFLLIPMAWFLWRKRPRRAGATG